MALVLENVYFSYEAGNYLFENLNIKVPEASTIAVMGPSGIGKTTLSKLLVGLIKPNQGKVRMYNKVLERPNIKANITFQENPCFPWLNVLDNVKFGMPDTPQSTERAKYLIDQMGLTDSLFKYPQALSGGMKQRVSIARSLAVNPEFLVLDEPFSALDAVTKIKVFELLKREQQASGISYIIVLHSVEDAYDLSDEVLVFGGKPTKVMERILSPKLLPFDEFKSIIIQSIQH